MTTDNKGGLAEPQSGLKADNLSAEAAVQKFFAEAEQAESVEAEKVETPVPVKTDEPVAEAEQEPVAEEVETDPGEEQGPEEDQPSEEVPSKLPPELQESINKRIGKEVAKRKKLEDEVARTKAEYEAKMLELRQAQTRIEQNVIADDGPLANIGTLQELDAALQRAKSMRDWADEKLDSDDDEFTLNGSTINRQEVKRYKREAQRDIEDRIPQRRQFLQRQAQTTEMALRAFPWIKDPQSEQHKIAQQELRNKPYLAKDADALWMIGLAVEGFMALKARGQKQAPVKPKAVEKPKPTPPAVDVELGVAPPKVQRPDAAEQQYEERRKQVTKRNLSQEDVEALLMGNTS